MKVVSTLYQSRPAERNGPGSAVSDLKRTFDGLSPSQAMRILIDLGYAPRAGSPNRRVYEKRVNGSVHRWTLTLE